ncbi:Hypothetical_protein [Hexamita inflata]|uniref:Hypothetical_protein n=1 Tax=Hexamita inflata TaxID=28002 RepID=A0AA86TD11_9EUKA|nr:Hypothetical protein HINF_LOCUS2085 [Hexamita inflata]
MPLIKSRSSDTRRALVLQQNTLCSQFPQQIKKIMNDNKSTKFRTSLAQKKNYISTMLNNQIQTLNKQVDMLIRIVQNSISVLELNYIKYQYSQQQLWDRERRAENERVSLFGTNTLVKFEFLELIYIFYCFHSKYAKSRELKTCQLQYIWDLSQNSFKRFKWTWVHQNSYLGIAHLLIGDLTHKQLICNSQLISFYSTLYEDLNKLDVSTIVNFLGIISKQNGVLIRYLKFDKIQRSRLNVGIQLKNTRISSISLIQHTYEKSSCITQLDHQCLLKIRLN